MGSIIREEEDRCQNHRPRGCIPDYCASSKAKRLKQLRPGLTEQSRAACRHRQGIPFGLHNPFSSSTPFHLNEKLGCALFARAPRFTASRSLCVLKTHKTHSLTFVETLLKFQYRRLARVNPRRGAKFRLRPGLWAACRRCAGRAGQLCHVSSYERLRAFACSYERLRACSSAPGRV